MQVMIDILRSIWTITAEAAPWLLFGFLAAAIIKAWVPTGFISRQLGRRGVGSVAKASVIGIPLPLCSCGVLPTALGLRRQGASKPATVSFLVGTPEIGFDSFALSYVLLGPFMAMARPIAALFSALVAGLAALATGKPDEPAESPAKKQAPGAASCCGHGDGEEELIDKSPLAAGAHEHHDETGAGKPPGAWSKLAEGLHYVFTKLLDDIKWWLAIALVIAGVVMAFPGWQDMLAAWGRGPLAMVVMLVIGIPLYVCATGSTPIAAALLVAGVSPGTVLVFLLAGPATNIGSVAILRKELGTATVVGYLVAIAVTAMTAGLVTDWVVMSMGIEVLAQQEHAQHVLPRWLGHVSAILLILLAIRPLRRLIMPRPPGEAKPQAASCCAPQSTAPANPHTRSCCAEAPGDR